MFLLIKNVSVLVLSIFFLIFGLDILIGSFKMTNPLEFIVVLFSSSFVILFCIVGILYALFRLFPKKPNNEIDHADSE